MKGPFSYKVERRGTTSVLRLTGRLTHEGAYSLQTEFLGLLQKGQRHLILDFEQVTFIDSIGIGMLLLLSAETRRVGGNVALSGASSAVANVLEMTTRNLVFKFYRDVESAKQGLTGDGQNSAPARTDGQS